MTTLTELTTIAQSLSQAQQQLLLDYALMLASEGEQSEAASETSEGKADKGYIEIKMVKGHPYAYRRWREGKTLKSKYVGKVKA